ncbi:unnamed protein product [Dibothriocephalus latus]|uniref:BACK domain-containing protein n=1 Tax=Dibothriocephalus latus TaxID=60516 RepID=A0A3P7LAW0_DIBLA|nr:unnamed protein product [Dibothriocephalus latus]
MIVLSQQLIMPHVEEWVVNYMAGRLNHENIENRWNLSQLLKSDHLRNACLEYMKKTFEAIAVGDLFIQLPSDAVLSLLRADDLQVDSEESLFKAIGSPILMQFYTTLLITPETDCFFVIGGNKWSDGNTRIWKFATRTRRWTECAPLPEWREHHTAVAVAVGEETVICVCGGTYLNCGSYTSHASALYSPTEDKWYELPKLRNMRQCAAAVALPDGRVFVMGGRRVINPQYGSFNRLSSVETCHLREPADWQGPLKASVAFWKNSADMLEPRENHMAAVFRESIFIAGGRNDQGYLKTIEVFTLPDNERPLGQWTRLANWESDRQTAALVVYQDRLFSFGTSAPLTPAITRCCCARRANVSCTDAVTEKSRNFPWFFPIVCLFKVVTTLINLAATELRWHPL